jgi:predicted Zn finger-like uncharacterized protein
MSLATRCTACGTIFRVVQDQLKVSEGWVRCGRCQQVFNALEGLFDLEREAPPQRTQPTLSATELVARGVREFVSSRLPSEPARTEAPLPAPRPAAADTEPSDFTDARFRPSELPLDAAVDDLHALDEFRDDSSDAAAVDAEGAPEPGAERPSASRVPLLQRWRERRDARESAALSSLLEAQPVPAQTELPFPSESLLEPPIAVRPSTPGFMRKANAAARWQRPRVRASLVVAGLLLIGMLSVQVMVQFRDALAAYRPDWRPRLELLCEVMRCRIEPLRRLAALTVESSALTQADGSGAYRLSLGLLNRGPVDVAAPSVELSLTDARGLLIARRALSPADFRGPGAGAAAPLAAGTEAPWQVLLAIDGLRVNGYTVELFYP